MVGVATFTRTSSDTSTKYSGNPERCQHLLTFLVKLGNNRGWNKLLKLN